ncbi:APC family permease [Mycobacterium sp.]|uniref:APC family permease n=1 Tax=Mycobacterium sp. TaxID=1785 RepID=UPI002BB5BAC4|nr:APC family permease [Mycobacterium sp.]HKP42188.1 APC family permease [Mycobacterium sp.]
MRDELTPSVCADPLKQPAVAPVVGLRSNLTAWRLILLVVAAAAPLGAVVGILPVAFAFGNGAGLPFTVALVMVVLALFSVGYSAMSRQVVSTGAFYAYVSRGLGGVAGLGAAAIALVAYPAITCTALAYFGYFTQAAVTSVAGGAPSWIWFSIGAAIAVGVLGYRGIDLSFRVVAVLVCIEFAVIISLVVAIVGRLGLKALPAESFSVHQLSSGAPGVAVMLVFLLFVGFESAALYSEEAHNPRRTVARATYGVVAVMGVFYLLVAWVTVGAVGGAHIVDVATTSTGSLYSDLAAGYLAPWVGEVITVAMATSMFATALALHNVASRYVFALGRQRCLPAPLGSAHPRLGGPHRASLVVSVVTTSVVLIGAIVGADPFVGLGTVAAGLGTVGVMTLQCLASLAVVGYLRRHGGGSMWATIVAPVIAFAAMAAATVLAVSRFEMLTGADNPVINALPALIAVVFVAGAGYGVWLKARRPQQYGAVTARLSSESD